MKVNVKICKTVAAALLLPALLSLTLPIKKADGPYILGRNGTPEKMLTVADDGKVEVQAIDPQKGTLDIEVYKNNGKKAFSFPYIRKEFAERPARVAKTGKIYALSDPHGEYDYVVKNLRENGVMDKNCDWTFGRGQFVLIGDVFDRGKDVMPIFWLLYKLRGQAEKAGGEVFLLLGNHEEMVLRNDVRYTDKRYLALADSLGITYADLFAADSEIGDWLDSQNTIQIIGDYMFVHAGISPTVVNSGLSPDEMNRLIRSGLREKRQTRNQNDTLKMLFGSQGPLWYRGLVHEDIDKYDYVDDRIVQSILDHYGVKQMIIGHSEFKTRKDFFGGKVVDINIDASSGHSAGILIP